MQIHFAEPRTSIMPSIPNPRHEAFCLARARGFSKDDAYEAAGFAPRSRNGARLQRRPDIAERIAELRAEQPDIGGATMRSMVAALLRMASAGEAIGSATGIREARESLLEAWRMSEELHRRRERERGDDEVAERMSRLMRALPDV
jgi:hypothetical protein